MAKREKFLVMLKRGESPYLECSSRGDRRFSAFHARPKSLNGKSIEEAYQGMKVFADAHGRVITGLSPKEAKGRYAVNYAECVEAYERWWREWVKEQELDKVLMDARGLSDMFGKEGAVCQADVLWNIRWELIRKDTE